MELKPKIKTAKVYNTVELKGLEYSCDRCFATMKEDHIELNVHIDGTGNIFKLYYKDIK